MPPSAPKPPPARKPDLDQPWQPGDPLPVPEAVHSDGDTAWELWNEVAGQHDRRFAPTAPMTESPAAPRPGDPAWAKTQPASRSLPLPRQKRERPLFTLEAAMLVARRNNRVCPRPERWTAFSALLPPLETARGELQPPAPVTGRAWEVTPPLTKRLHFREQIEWAERAGVLEPVMAFLQSMAEEEWLHMGED
jgi:hypothetical protein